LKTNVLIIAILALFSFIAGYLLSAISWVGRTGINLFYTEYKFLKVWWKGAGLVFIVWVILYGLQSYMKSRSNRSTFTLTYSILLIVAVAGLYFSYSDFRHTISHRWLGERFHLGVYLFWLGWIGISIYGLATNKNAAPLEMSPENIH